MAEKEKNPFGGLKQAAQKGLASIDMEALKEKAAEATEVLKEKAVEVKDQLVEFKEFLAEEEKSQLTQKKYLRDVLKFLEWLGEKT